LLHKSLNSFKAHTVAQLSFKISGHLKLQTAWCTQLSFASKFQGKASDSLAPTSAQLKFASKFLGKALDSFKISEQSYGQLGNHSSALLQIFRAKLWTASKFQVKFQTAWQWHHSSALLQIFRTKLHMKMAQHSLVMVKTT
jgi:hypothetical protein